VRDRLLAALAAQGLSPEVRSVFACDAWGTCATTENVFARVDWSAAPAGAASARVAADRRLAVMLAAHYDSVGAGPGAGDDGAGVAAILETVRALRAGPPLARPVLLWIDDGEEAGLLGAEAFAEQPERAEVGAVVNLEARGTTGQSLMFETRKDNAWVIAALAPALPRPAMSSIFYTIYQYLPNDTDFSVFKRDGLQGANFAFVGEPMHYHTPLDDLAHLDPGTLQHQGENALASVRAFAAADLEGPPVGDAVYFDVLGLGVVRWPQASTPSIAGLAIVLLGLAIVRRRRAGELTLLATLGGLFAWLAVLLLAGGGAFCLHQLLRALGAVPGVWVAHPEPILLALWLTPLLVALLLAPPLARRLGEPALWAGAWLGTALVGMALALTLPGVSFLFVVPALAAGPLAWNRVGPLARRVPATLAAVLIFPVAWTLWDGMGAPISAGIALLVACVVALLLADLTARRAVAVTAFALILAAVAVASRLPTFSSERPGATNLVLVDDRDRATASVLVQGGLAPPALTAAAPFARPAEPQYPWLRQPSLATPAAALAEPAPEADVLAPEANASPAGDGRTVRLRLRSPRGASRLRLYVPATAGLRSVRIAGRTLPPTTERDAGAGKGDRFFNLLTVPAAGVEVELVLDGPPTEVVLQDITPGLPESVRSLRERCGRAFVPIGFGDATVIQRRLRL
jgi:hypothetical protein